jgi:molecular chaperone GrpE
VTGVQTCALPIYLAEERLDQLKRCRADLDNTLKIVTREREEHARYASEKLVSKLLCVLDSLEQASKHDEGCKALYHQLLDVLKGEGLEPITALGQKFDPYKHEALMQVKSDELDEDYVAQEIQRGYTLNSRVIRFSKVAVVKR